MEGTEAFVCTPGMSLSFFRKVLPPLPCLGSGSYPSSFVFGAKHQQNQNNYSKRHISIFTFEEKLGEKMSTFVAKWYNILYMNVYCLKLCCTFDLTLHYYRVLHPFYLYHYSNFTCFSAV